MGQALKALRHRLGQLSGEDERKSRGRVPQRVRAAIVALLLLGGSMLAVGGIGPGGGVATAHAAGYDSCNYYDNGVQYCYGYADDGSLLYYKEATGWFYIYVTGQWYWVNPSTGNVWQQTASGWQEVFYINPGTENIYTQLACAVTVFC